MLVGKCLPGKRKAKNGRRTDKKKNRFFSIHILHRFLLFTLFPLINRMIPALFISIFDLSKTVDAMDLTLFLVVILTAVFLVVAAWGLDYLLSPRSFNGQKGEAYECGIPTRGKSWMQFKVGYYLFAILFLIFDVEAMFMFPWAVIVREVGVAGLFNILFFMLILVLGLAYAWKKGALEWK